MVRQAVNNAKVRLVGRFVVHPMLRGREENVQPLEKFHDLRRRVCSKGEVVADLRAVGAGDPLQKDQDERGAVALGAEE